MAKFDRSFIKSFGRSYDQAVPYGAQGYQNALNDKAQQSARMAKERQAQAQAQQAQAIADQDRDIIGGYAGYREDPTKPFDPRSLQYLTPEARASLSHIKTYYDNLDKKKKEYQVEQEYDAYRGAKTPEEKQRAYLSASKDTQTRIKSTFTNARTVDTRKSYDENGNEITVLVREDDFGNSWTEELPGDVGDMSTGDTMAFGGDMSKFYDKFKVDEANVYRANIEADLLTEEFNRQVQERVAQGEPLSEARQSVDLDTGLLGKINDTKARAGAYKQVITRTVIDNSSPDVKDLSLTIPWNNKELAKETITKVGEVDLDKDPNNDTKLNPQEWYALGYLYYINTGERLNLIDEIARKKQNAL